MVPGLEDAFRSIARHPLINFDTALVPSWEVVATALDTVGTDRIMFGSDEPLHLIRSVAYRHPDLGERIMTDYPYHWLNEQERLAFGHLAVGAVHAHWQSLDAIKEAIAKYPEHEQERVKQQLFHDNATTFFGF